MITSFVERKFEILARLTLKKSRMDSQRKKGEYEISFVYLFFLDMGS